MDAGHTSSFSFRRLAAMLLAAALLTAAALPAPPARAATAAPPLAVSGLSILPQGIALDNSRGQTSATFNHETPQDSPSINATPPNTHAEYIGRAVRYTLHEYAKGYRGQPQDRTYDDRRDVDWGGGPFTIDGLPSGSIFDATATTFLQYVEYTTGQNATSRTGDGPESARSGLVRFCTGAQLSAALAAPDQVRLSWDDIWYNNERVYGYDLNVYTSAASTAPESTTRFTRNQIGQGQPIAVNQAAGKLEYTYTAPYPGRVYAFEVVPVLTNVPGVVAPSRNARVTVATLMLVSAAKLYEGQDNTVTWEIKWSNVTAGMAGSSPARYTAEYSLARLGGGASYTLLQRLNNDTSTIVVTPKDPDAPENLNAMYEITAKVFENGQEMYVGDNVTITTGPFSLKESEPPHTPQAPGIRLTELRPASEPDRQDGAADLWWGIPRLVTDPEAEDRDVRYDMYVFTDPLVLNALLAQDGPGSPGAPSTPGATATPPGTPAAPNAPNTPDMPSPTYTLDGALLQTAVFGSELGFRYTVPNLAQNTTYYVALRAVKTFVDASTMTNARYASAVSYLSFTTEPALPTGQPPAPVTLALVKDSVLPDAASFTAATLWHELFDTQAGVWAVCEPMFETDGSPLPDNDAYRTLGYERGDRITLYYVLYEDGMDLDDPGEITGFSTRPFDFGAIAEGSLARADATGLQPNTTYVFWARAERGAALSFPSRAFAVTTPPDPNLEIGDPTVPDFSLAYIGDTYVDMLWIKKPSHRYNIQVSTVDAFDGQGAAGAAGAATGTAGAAAGVTTHSVSTDGIEASGVDFYRVTGLRPDTVYYFRIQAEVTSPVSGDVKMSAWSDSKPARTRPPMPPATPSGFGVRPGSGSVTKNSIHYEWLGMAGLTYILEYSQDEKLAGPKEIQAGPGGDYRLDGLLSNHRYYARLYAYDPATGLRSAPTYIVGVRTLRSGDDYDSNVDTTLPLGGEYVRKGASAEKGVWHVRVAGTDADRLAQRIATDAMLDYEIDLRSPPPNTAAISVVVEGKVMEALDAMKERLALRLHDKTIIIRPKTLTPSLGGAVAASAAASGAASGASVPAGTSGTADAWDIPGGVPGSRGYSFELLLRVSTSDAPGDPGGFYEAPRGFTPRTDPTGIEARVVVGSAKYPIYRFLKPIGVVVPFGYASWYKAGTTTGAVLLGDGSGGSGGSGSSGGSVGSSTGAYGGASRLSGAGAWQAAKAKATFDPDEGRGTLAFDCPGPGYAMAADFATRSLFADVDGKALASYVNRLGALGYADVPLGAAFRPGDAATPQAALTMLYAALGYSRDGADGSGGSASSASPQDFAALAKAGLIGSASQSELLIEEALAIIGRAYATHTGVSTVCDSFMPGLGDVREPVRSLAQTAADNGLAQALWRTPPSERSPFPAGRAATRAEVAALVCALLDALGMS